MVIGEPLMAFRFDYFRGGRHMSSRKADVFALFVRPAVLAGAGLLSALPAWSQYPGQVTKSGKETPELRSIAVLEWTGEAGKPKASRLVPVAVLDGGQLQDGGLYLARPEPLALAGGVEYELQQNGKPVGLYDIKNAGQEQGSWVGYGAWKSLPAARPRPSQREMARIRIDDDAQSDSPVLHRKHHADDAPAGGAGSGGSSGGGGSSQTGSSGPATASDPDRPTLHKKSGSDTGDASATSSSSAPAPDTDPDRPTLHKKASSESDSGSAAPDDPDQPKLKKKKQSEDVGHVDSMPDVTDADRPRLMRGRSSGAGPEVLPSLMGLPPEMQQTVAVSDARSRPEHPWSYTWANPDDEAKMKLKLEEMARDALGLKPPPPPPASKRTPARKNAKPVSPLPPPAPLMDEQFRVFELAYGSGATQVLTAHTDAPRAQMKFVTLVTQPDLYGNVLVLMKSVTDSAHLDETPRMRLVDAVDAMADNRGELLFELRGATQRQFALYRVLRGQAEKQFVSGGGDFGTEGK